MSQYWILAAIALPILGGIGIPLLPFGKRKWMLVYIEAVVLLTSCIVGGLLLNGTTETFIWSTLSMICLSPSRLTVSV